MEIKAREYADRLRSDTDERMNDREIIAELV
jgi:hypothetical protein